MGIIIVGGVPLGMMLGLYFTWHVLFPACGLITLLVLLYPAGVEHSLLSGFLYVYLVTASVQIGCVIGLLARCLNGDCNRLAAAAIATTPLFLQFPH